MDLIKYTNEDNLKLIARLIKNWLSAKLDTLISGFNIKTLNYEPLLGEGNIDLDSLLNVCSETEIKNILKAE